MFSYNFDNDVLEKIKNFFKRRKENKYRSSVNNGGTEGQEQVVSDIEGKESDSRSNSGVLNNSDKVSSHVNNNSDMINLSDDAQITDLSSNVREILREIIKKIKKKKADKKKKEEIENNIHAGQEPDFGNSNNTRQEKTVEDIKKSIKRIVSVRSAQINQLRQTLISQQQIEAQNAQSQKAAKELDLKSQLKEQAANKDNKPADDKDISDKKNKNNYEQAIGHFKNDLGSSGKLNPIKNLADSVVKGGEPRSRNESSVNLKQEASSQNANAEKSNWVNKLDANVAAQNKGNSRDI